MNKNRRHTKTLTKSCEFLENEEKYERAGTYFSSDSFWNLFNESIIFYLYFVMLFPRLSMRVLPDHQLTNKNKNLLFCFLFFYIFVLFYFLGLSGKIYDVLKSFGQFYLQKKTKNVEIIYVNR